MKNKVLECVKGKSCHLVRIPSLKSRKIGQSRSFRGALKMKFFSGNSKSVSRRGLLRLAGMFAAAGVVMAPGLAFAGGGMIDVTASPYGAVPNSSADSSGAFQTALNAIAKNGGGRLYVPSGNYILASPLTYSGGSLTIVGDGQDSTLLINSHSGTVLTINLGDTSNCLTMRDLGFSPCVTGVAQGAVAIVVPANPSGWQNVIIEDVCVGAPYAFNGAQYTAYHIAVSLTNTTRARVSNVNVHGNITGGVAVALSGDCYDTRVLGCTLEGYSYGVAVLAYCEGLHLANNVIICNTAVYTGAANYNSGPFAINLLELFMSDCEINTDKECLNLYQVKNAQISNCHFTGPKDGNGGAAIHMLGCSESLVESSTFCGAWKPGNNVEFGIAFMPTDRTPTTSCSVSNVQFENTTVGIYFGPGATANIASDVQLLTYGTGALVNGASAYSNQSQQVFIDNSGNTTNNASWITSANTFAAIPGRRGSSEH
jgi:hypothetical protein